MKILVLGGTGAMGVHLVDNLTKSGVDTYVTTRSSKKSENNLHYLQGNAHDIEFLKEIVREQWDSIVDFMVYTTSSFQERVELLLSATRQYVFLSSSRVYADSNKLITEYSPRLLDTVQDKEFLLTDEYSLTKARQEDILKNSRNQNWTIIRPYITYAENRLQLGVLEKEGWLYRALKGRTIVFSEEICSKLTTLTYGSDVSKAMLSIIGNNKALGEVFHITTHESYTWSFILNIYLDVLNRHLGYRPKVLLQNMKDFVKVHPAKYQIKYDRLFNRQFDNSKITCFYNDGYMSLEEGLSRSLLMFLNKPEFKPINWGLEGLKDRQTNEYTNLKEISSFKQKVKYLLYRYVI